MQDPNYYSDTLLLCAYPDWAPFDGSSKNKSLTVTGNVSIVTTQKLPFGTGSFYFDGNGDYISVSTSGDPDLGGPGDFTLEMAVYFISLAGTPTFLASRRQSFAKDLVFTVGTSGEISLVIYSSDGVISINLITAPILTTGVWYQLAWTVEANTARIFVDGLLVASGTFTNAPALGEVLVLGAHVSNATRYLNGYLDQIRFTKGLARYTANYTPLNEPFETNIEIATPLPLPPTTELLWANQETREQAWPGENSIEKLDCSVGVSVPIIKQAALLAPPVRADFGFIEGVVTRKSVPAAGKHVICLDDRFNLVAETTSAANGYYRFDNLLITGLYAIHAYDNETYQYAPVGADRRTPEAYP